MQSARSRSIVMLNQMDKKKRAMLEKSIDKKLANAEKVARREAKVAHEKIHKTNEKAATITNKMRMEQRADERERTHTIREIMANDTAEREKV